LLIEGQKDLFSGFEIKIKGSLSQTNILGEMRHRKRLIPDFKKEFLRSL
jgi:hypothetical protein